MCLVCTLLLEQEFLLDLSFFTFVYAVVGIQHKRLTPLF